MNVKGAAMADTFGETVASEFEDMDANGEHGLALTLVATALIEVAATSAEAVNVVGSVLARVSALVREYQEREVPFKYV